MRKIKKPQSNNFYLFMGRSNANSCWIEKLEHAELFLTYANYYLNGYLKIYDYIINEEGWIIVVKILSIEQIGLKLEEPQFEVWRIISERMRLFLSRYVTESNRMKDRTGCLVHSTYERYYFETLKEAIGVINDIRQQRYEMFNGNLKYKSLDSHYEISKSVGKGSVYLCSKRIRRAGFRGGFSSEVFSLQGLTIAVLQSMIKTTTKCHNPTFHSKKSNETKMKPTQKSKNKVNTS